MPDPSTLMSNPVCKTSARALTGVLALWLLAALLPLPAPGAVGHACEEVACQEASIVARRVVLDTAEGRVEGDLYLPSVAEDLRGGAILAHGFLRPRTTMQNHARALAARGIVALVPSLPYKTDPAGNARALRELAGQLRQGRFAPAVAGVVLIGFSAGALAAVLAAPGLPGLSGLIALDPFDRRSQPGRESAGHVAAPTLVMRAPPAACNGYGSASSWAATLPRLDRDILIPRATHCDFEAPTTLACRLACFGTDDARRAVIRETLLEAVGRYLPTRGGR